MKKYLFVVLLAALFIPQLVSAHGALAIERHHGQRYGFSYDYYTMGGAVRRALRECGRNCYIVQRFSRGCAAYAADQTRGSTVYGWGLARSGRRARFYARRYCRNYGGRRCIIRVWGCNSR